jgi:N-formylglutamate deformylase
MESIYTFKEGQVPLLVSMPHSGTNIPNDIASQLTVVAKETIDTDWHLPLLYNMLDAMGVSQIQAQYSRYVIDLNRSSNDENLYPGQDTTGLCPIDTFEKRALYQNKLPSKEEIQRRIEMYWRPYHQKIQEELERIRKIHGIAILWDAHSIASQVPRFFDGKLSDLNFGTADQKSCSVALQTDLQNSLFQSTNATSYSQVFNGRFKGGYITRQYGQPEKNIHAVQLEMSQCLYMNEESPFSYREDLAAKIQPVLKTLLNTCIDWAQRNSIKVSK